MSFDLDAAIAKAKAEIEIPTHVDVPVVLADLVLTVRFTKLIPLEWRNLIATVPPRLGAAVDAGFGFNKDLVGARYPVAKIAIVDGDEVSQVTQEQWDGVCAGLESPHIARIGTALWGIHDYNANERAEAAKKAFEASTATS